MNDIELQALTTLVNHELAQWNYGIQRYGEAPFNPETEALHKLREELQRRSYVK